MPFRIHLLSDLHLKFSAFDPPEVDADILVLCGDIGNGLQGVKWAKKLAPRYKYGVAFVAGNHDLYKTKYPSHIQALRDEAEVGSKVYVLENEELTFLGRKDIRILAATMWTDFCLYGIHDEIHAAFVAGRNMNDYSQIKKDDGSKLTPLDTYTIHKESLEWLKSKLAEPFDGKTIVITHHAPSIRCIDPRFTGRNDALSPAFASNLEYLMEPRVIDSGVRSSPDLWLYGHTHFNADFTINGTHIVSNQRGYPSEPGMETFDPSLVIVV